MMSSQINPLQHSPASIPDSLARFLDGATSSDLIALVSLVVAFVSLIVSIAAFPPLNVFVGNLLMRQVHIGEPTIENPYATAQDAYSYGDDGAHGMRFVRVSICPGFLKLRGVACEMMVVDAAAGKTFDFRGTMHWQRQPRGDSHLRSLHENCKDVADYLRHMYVDHFAHSEPVCINTDDPDKVDLFLRLETQDFYVAAGGREQHFKPGRYTIRLRITADNLNVTLRKEFTIDLPGDYDDLVPETVLSDTVINGPDDDLTSSDVAAQHPMG